MNKELTQSKIKIDRLNSDLENCLRELSQLASLVKNSEKRRQAALNQERALAAAAQQEREYLNARIASLDEQLVGNKSWAKQLQDRTKIQDRELGQISNMLRLAESDRNNSAQTLAEMEVEHQNLHREMERLAYENHSLTSSTSWRVTVPLRKIMGLLRRG